MKCKKLFQIISLFVVVIVGLIAFSSCDEMLPTYHFPQNVISANFSEVEQMSIRIAPPGYQKVYLVLEIENTYDDVFYDSVDIKGTITIWWQRKPQRYVTLNVSQSNMSAPSLISDGKLLMLPGQKISLSFIWDMKTNDSIYLPYQMSYTYATTVRSCDYNVICSDPEQFVVESSILLYDKLGYFSAPAVQFTFTGTECRNGCGGPYCLPGHGC